MAGGRVTRSITQRAEGVQAMLLPPAPLADAPGFKRYAREPEVSIAPITWPSRPAS
ncbi:Uncharacterised protein [Bordetella pertussis]|nr:Uncharacterised protein [Bordetella pertussis]